MSWRTDIENAPKGETETRNFTHHQSGKKVERGITLKVPVLISSNGQVIQSVWSEKRGQWSGLATGETPEAWMPWPKPFPKTGEAQ